MNAPRATIYTLRFAIFIMGFTSIAWQILILRELLVVFQGIELTFGIIFALWLLLEAAGCTVARKRAETTKNPVLTYSILHAAIGICAVSGIVFLRYFKFLFDIPMGQALGYHYVILISFLVLAPVTLIKGAMFPFACRNMDEISHPANPSVKVYIVEAAGAFTAGLLFVLYLIYRLDHIFLAWMLLLVNFIAVLLYLYSLQSLSVLRTILFVCTGSFIVLYAMSFPKTLHERSSEKLWYEGNLLETRNSEYANIAGLESEGQFTFFVNGVPFASVPEPVLLVEEQAHFPLLFHTEPEHVLVISGGAGGVIDAIMKHPAEELHYAEQDPLLIDFFRRYPTPLTERELLHPSVTVHLTEGMRFLRTTDQAFDVILVNLPPPSTLLINRYYTKEFFELARSRLNRGGIVSVSLPGSETFLVDELVFLNRLIYTTLHKVFKDIRIIIGEKNIFIASEEGMIADANEALLAQRLRERNIIAGLIDEHYIRYKMDPLRFGSFIKEITEDAGQEINTHIFPRGIFRSTMLHTLTVTPALVGIMYGIDSLPAGIYAVIIVVGFLVLIIIRPARRSPIVIGNAIATTGFASMLMYILLLLYFQIFYGYVYHYIGLLTAFFMGGTAIGAYLASRHSSLSLFNIDASIVGVIGLFLLASISEMLPLPAMQVLIFICMIAMGLLTGMAYPVAVRMIQQTRKSVSNQPGKLYALDLFGAFLGAFLTALILLPSLGIHTTLLLVVSLKVSSTILLYINSNPGHPTPD